MTNHTNFVTIKTYDNTYELSMAKSFLESQGIVCSIKDEFTIQVNPFYSNAIGGIKLQVLEHQLEQAQELLNNQTPATETQNAATETHHSSDIICPNCGSNNTLKNKISPKVFAICILLLGFPLPFARRTYHCFNCSTDFKLNK
jgi:DNA-directed RNA polymerase subunit RPC12/RpoP